MRSTFWFVALLAACGPDETEFVPEYADLYCDYVLECADPAALTFDGVLTHDDCLAVYGPVIDAEGDGCDYAAKSAKRCLTAMELTSCPSEGAPLEDGIPAVCNEVYACTGAPATSTPPDTGS